MPNRTWVLLAFVLLGGLTACTSPSDRDRYDSTSRPDASLAKLDGGGGGGDADGGTCTTPQTSCDGTCVNLSTDPTHCGECGRVCESGLECVAGKCKPSACPQPCGEGMYCDTASKTCKAGCATDAQCPQPGSCDTASHTCRCAMGTHRCGDTCASNTSVDSCGEACSPCPAPINGVATCDGETCGSECGQGYHLCGNQCVSSFSTDSCGTSCTPCTAPWNGTASCNGVSCSIQCGAGTHQCGSNCVYNDQVSNCGSSCTPCPKPANGYATCDGTSCGIECASGYAACSGQCVTESVSQCGASCQRCTQAPANGTPDCMNGACSFRCSAPYIKSGSTCTLATAVSSQRNDTCVISSSGGVRCWNKADVGLSSSVSAISSGDGHSCAIRSGGLRCWGDNGYGQLGNGTYTSSDTAVTVTFPTGVSIAQVSAGADHTCAVSTTGQLFCWGRNYWGEFGNGTKTGSNKPVLISSNGIAQVAAGETFTCARLTGGTVQCAGYNYWGQLGQGATNTTDSTTFVSVPNLSNVASVHAGDNHVCAITTTNGLKCWGANTRYQTYSAGDCSTRGVNDYCGVPKDAPGYSSGVAAVSLGTQLTCILKTNGDVHCRGYNDYGQVGVGYRGQNAASSSPVVTGATAIAAAAQGYHVCALMSGGGVKCWGYNSYGQLGDGTRTDRYTPVDATAP